MNKHFNAIVTGLLMFLFIMPAMAGSKETRKAVNLKVPREIKRQAKEYEKNGYYVAIGAPTLERQLTTAWMKENETDDHGFPKYIPAFSQSVGETQIAAKLQATEAARLELAGKIASNIAALVENNFANAQLNAREASSVTQTVATSKSIIAQELGMTITAVELYRNIGNNIESSIRLLYSSDTATSIAKKLIRQQLKDQTDLLQEKLDKLMEF